MRSGGARGPVTAAFPGLALGLALLSLVLVPTTARSAPHLGVSDGPYRELADPVADTAARLGVGSMRVLVDWSTVQPDRGGAYQWSIYDGFLGALRRHGIRPLLLVVNSPAWAQEPGDLCLDRRCPPADAHLDAWRAFVEATARRYSGGTLDMRPVGVEVWNEPNIETNWYTARGPDVARYARILEFAAAGVRAAAPGLPVVLGGLAPTGETRRDSIIMEDFVEAVYARGGASWFDGLGIHAYPHPVAGEDFTPGLRRARSFLDRLRAVRDRRGDLGTPLWVTETGLIDPEEIPPGTTRGPLLVSLVDALVAGPDVAGIYVYRLRRPDNERGWGLTDQQLRPLSGFDELRARFAIPLAGATPQQRPARRRRAARKVRRRARLVARKEPSANHRSVPARARR